MALPLLATVAELAARLGISVPDGAERLRAEAAIRDASTLARAATRTSWVDTEGELVADVPEVVGMVVLTAARRAFENPSGVTQKTAQDVSVSYASRSESAVYLTDAEEELLRGAVPGSRRGVFTLATTRSTLATDTIYVPTNGGPDFPWYAADDPLVGL